jgi:hypothetical protein
MLRLELAELEFAGFDLSLTGFADLELKDLMADRTDGLTDPDDAPAVPEHPVSQTGDLWLLGAKVTCPKCRKSTPLEPARSSPRCPRAASIKEWGWTTPALVGEDGGLIAGHARVLAARQLGIVEIPVMVAAGWTEAQKRACVLADNQLAITGSGWDPEPGTPCAKAKPRIGRATGREPRYGKIDKNMKSETGHSTQKPVECRADSDNGRARSPSATSPRSGAIGPSTRRVRETFALR